MAKKAKQTTEFPEASEEPTTVIGKKRVRRKYSLGDDYKAWKAFCDELKTKAAFHSSEAARYRNEYKKYYENGADGFCNERDDREWEKANNLITIAEMKESERANAWKTLPVDKLDLRVKLIETLKKVGFDTIGELSEWLGADFKEPKKGLGEKTIETLGDAVNKFTAPYHKPIIQAEVERARAKREELSQ